MLDKEYKYYQDNQVEFLKKYKGKAIVIKNKEIVGVYDNEVEAYKDATSKYELGTFLIQTCLPEGETAQTFYSRVVFS